MATELTIAGLKTFLADYVVANKICQGTYTSTNEVITGLTDKIGAQFTVPLKFTNPLTMFDRGVLPVGVDVEEYLDELLLPESYSNHGGTYTADMTEDELKPRYPLVDKAYSKVQGAFKFAKSFPIAQVKRAFISAAALADFEGNLLAGLYQAKEISKYVETKKLIKVYVDLLKASSNAANAYHLSAVAPTTEATAINFIKNIKAALLDMSFVSSNFSVGGHASAVNKENMVLLLNKSCIPSIQVDGRRNSFNLAEIDFGCPVVVLDDFGESTTSTILAVLIDQAALGDYLTVDENTENLNASGRYRTYFTHSQHTLVVSKFANGQVWDTAAA